MKVTLPAVVNGQILPGDVDRYRFTAQKGQRLVVAASARELIPYLADAVPGWFQATLALYDAKGKELAYDDDYRFNPDPVLFYEIPEDGEYVIEIKDAIYRGREDFVYRITVGELPFVTSIFPLGGRAGTPTNVELRGWNLPTKTLTPSFGDAEVGIHQLSVGRDEWVVQPRAVRRGHAAGVPGAGTEQPAAEGPAGHAADDRQRAHRQERRLRRVPLRGPRRQRDRGGSLRPPAGFAAGFGAQADRCRRPATGVQRRPRGQGGGADHAPRGFLAPCHAAGRWNVLSSSGDAQHKGGPEYAYRLRISPPQPDFELRVVPSSINVRGGTSVPLTVYALRKDGFAGEIALALKDAPAGFVLSGGWVPAGQDQVQVTLTVPPTPTQEPLSLSLEGRATIDGREIVHPAVPAEDMMQAFAYRHLVPARELRVAVSGRWMSKAPVKILSESPVKIPPAEPPGCESQRRQPP